MRVCGSDSPVLPSHATKRSRIAGPVLDVVVQGQPLPGLSARHVLQDLLATRSVPKARQKRWIRSVDTFVKSATDEAGTQLLRQQLQRLGIAGAYAPCTAEHNGYLGVRGELFLQREATQTRSAQRLGMGSCRCHVWDAKAQLHGEPRRQDQDTKPRQRFEAKTQGCRGRAACGHACHVGIFTPCDVILVGDHGGKASAYGVPLPAPQH